MSSSLGDGITSGVFGSQRQEGTKNCSIFSRHLTSEHLLWSTSHKETRTQKPITTLSLHALVALQKTTYPDVHETLLNIMLKQPFVMSRRIEDSAAFPVE